MGWCWIRLKSMIVKSIRPPFLAGIIMTTQTSGYTPVRLDVCSMSLHMTCSTYDFSYNILVDTHQNLDF